MASNDDFYANAAQKKFNELAHQRLRAQHDLAVSLSDGDEFAAANEIETIAEIDAKQANLIALAQREVARQNPPQQERESVITSRRAPADGNDALEIINYGKRPGDPTIVTPQEYNRQMSEFQRLKAKGMYKE
jgi:hypothetical protein